MMDPVEYEDLPLHTTKIDARVKLQIGEKGLSAEKPVTLIDLINEASVKYPTNKALAWKKENNWNFLTYNEYKTKIYRLSKLFIHLGFQKRDSIGIMAFNSPEWFYSALAAVAAGGVIAGVYTTNGPDAVKHVLEASKASICVVDNQKQMNKILQIKSELPKLKIVIQINEPLSEKCLSQEGFFTWEDIENMMLSNEENLEEANKELESRMTSLAPNECCSLIFTSGTTGKPKGVMLSHDNLIFTIKTAYYKFNNIKLGEEVFITYLPLNHIAAQVLDMYLPIAFGGCVYFADRDALKGTLIETMLAARPTRFLGVPRVWEKFHEKLIKMEANFSTLTGFLLNLSKKFVSNYYLAEMNGGHGNRLTYRIGQAVTNKIKAGLGLDRCMTFFTGAAPTNIETKRYFCSIDIFLNEAYGLSEAGAAGLSDSIERNFETIGRPLEGVEIKINNPDEKGIGEIYIRSRSVFMGYLDEPEKTAEAFDNEWYKTGDLGQFDSDGYLYIVGRVKELIITAGGENIPFGNIEDAVKNELPGISNSFLVGDRKKFLTMLLTIKTEMDKETGRPLDNLQFESLEWMKSLDLKYIKLSEILEAGPCPTVLKSIQDGIDRYNKKAISNAQTVKKFAILDHDFSMVTEELGPTLKLKRSFVMEKYKDIIEKFYV